MYDKNFAEFGPWGSLALETRLICVETCVTVDQE